MRLQPLPDKWNTGAAINAAWKRQQAILTTTTCHSPAIDVHHDVTAMDKQPVIHPDTQKPTGETPAECQNCTISKKCKTVLKMWYQRKPRPELVRAWNQLIKQHAADMPCLSELREGK